MDKSPADMDKVLEERISREKEKEKNTSIFNVLYDEQRSAIRNGEERLKNRNSWRATEQGQNYESSHYSSNESNEKYSKYHDEELRNLESGGLARKPAHPRQRSRCDYHLEDVIQSAFDGKQPVYKSMKVYISCLLSKPGEEPPRLRKEVWRW